MAQTSHVTDELKRVRSLLSDRRVKSPVTEVAADPSPESIGAQAGLGFKASESDVRFNVYVFEGWDASSAAVNAFSSQHKDEKDVYVATSMNGPLVFYGVVKTNVPDGVKNKFQLAGYLSAFAGKE